MEVGVNKNSHNIAWFVLFCILGLAFMFVPMLSIYVNIDKNSYEAYIYKGIGTIFIIIAVYKAFKPTDVDIPTDNENNVKISYKTFIDKLEIDKFNEIILMAHTGKNSLSLLRTKLTEKSNITNNIKIKIILKNPYSETTDRLGLTKSHIKTFIDDVSKINGISVDIRYYNGLPYFHALLCKYRNSEEYYSYISYYKWENYKTKACKIGNIINDDNNELFLTSKSWFEHLFSKKNLHTIVFDLDDTIIDSYDSQIKSWKFLLEYIFNNKNELCYLKEKLNADITEDSFEQYIENMFFQTTETDERVDYIFDKSLSDTEKQKIKKVRFDKREELTIDEAPLFTECKKTLGILSETYNLVIISATSEELVKKILDKYDLNSYFSFYLGVRDNQVESFDKAESKTPHLIKTSNLLGIPFDRIAFVGDSPTDFKAAKQLNIKFIAANMVATRLKQQPPSFITGHNGLSFDSYRNGSLLNIIKQNFN